MSQAIGCRGCGKPLTDEEREFYEDSCEQCEREDLERWQAWRHGADDPELDARFGVPRPTVQ